ncbi:hypothetical protein AAG906_031433 [Vitis piasezkii]
MVLKTKNSGGPAELLQVCWLEVSGSVPIRSSAPIGTKFRITFQVSFKSDAFGWNNCPVCVMARFGKKGKYTWTKITLRTDYSQPTNILPPEGLEIVTKDATTPNVNDTIYFGLYEVGSGKWKGGLELHNATYPENINMCLCVGLCVGLCAVCSVQRAACTFKSMAYIIGIKDAE